MFFRYKMAVLVSGVRKRHAVQNLAVYGDGFMFPTLFNTFS